MILGRKFDITLALKKPSTTVAYFALRSAAQRRLLDGTRVMASDGGFEWLADVIASVRPGRAS